MMLQGSDGFAIGFVLLPLVLAVISAGLVIASRYSVFDLFCIINATAVACSEFSIAFRALILPSALLALSAWRRRDRAGRRRLRLDGPFALLVGYLFLRGFPLGDSASSGALVSLMAMFASALACCLLFGSLDRPSSRRILYFYLVCGILAIAIGTGLDAFGMGPLEEIDLGHPVDTGFSLRLSAGFRHPNTLGFFALLELAICLALYRYGAIGRKLAALLGLFLVTTIAASGARGALVGLATSLMVAAAVDRPLRRVIARIAPAAIAAVTFLLVILAIANPGDLPGYFIERYSGIGAERQSASLESRGLYWQLAIEVFNNNPLFGVGTQNLPAAMRQMWIPDSYYMFLAPDVLTPAHNVFLQYASSAGLVGLGLLLFWLASFAAGSWRCCKTVDSGSQTDGMLGLICIAALVSVGLTDVVFGPH